MKTSKMKLDLDELNVESFDTTPAEGQKGTGTVQGYYLGTIQIISCLFACTDPTCNTCDASCGGTCDTCDASCGGTCETCDGPTCGSTCGGFTCDDTDPCTTCPSCPQIICG